MLFGRIRLTHLMLTNNDDDYDDYSDNEDDDKNDATADLSNDEDDDGFKMANKGLFHTVNRIV